MRFDKVPKSSTQRPNFSIMARILPVEDYGRCFVFVFVGHRTGHQFSLTPQMSMKSAAITPPVASRNTRPPTAANDTRPLILPPPRSSIDHVVGSTTGWSGQELLGVNNRQTSLDTPPFMSIRHAEMTMVNVIVIGLNSFY